MNKITSAFKGVLLQKDHNFATNVSPNPPCHNLVFSIWVRTPKIEQWLSMLLDYDDGLRKVKEALQ